MTDEEILAKFKELGIQASVHYADDSGKEWSMGSSLVTQARQLAADNPHLKSKMREIAKDFLWVF